MSGWVGGNLFTKQKKYSSGKNNSGSGKKNPCLTKRGRFNSNPTATNNPSDPINIRSALDKKNFKRMIILIKSGIK